MDHSVIKAETSDLHKLAETKLKASEIFSDSYSLDSYIVHLKKLFSVHQLFENSFKKVKISYRLTQIITDKDMRASDLALDLQNLGIPVKNSSEKAIGFNNEHNWIGAFYVLRGSALGNRLISGKLQKHVLSWGIQPQNFYSLNEHKYSQKWSAFKNELEIWTKEDYLQVSYGAKYIYSLFLEE